MNLRRMLHDSGWDLKGIPDIVNTELISALMAIYLPLWQQSHSST
ncbi:hypothetical protein swp_3896 [Shewanella piezotolerans WP3]|uniref:Uncharacterized protein n=1 Tax=Shewanella piezotolerans (strain WP3 / JCM 13877) TaxID=225849 RepID=B8CQV6_SHEPW|nr:hypothetical protein swp_3896 [Shewanella piezotolerans WP3]